MTWLSGMPSVGVCDKNCLASPVDTPDGEVVTDSLHKRGLIVKWPCPYAPGSHGRLTHLGRLALTFPCP